MKQLVTMVIGIVIGIGLTLTVIRGALSENTRAGETADSNYVAEFEEVDTSEEKEQKWMPPEEMSETEYETLAVEILEDIEFTMEDRTKTFLTKDELEKMENVFIIHRDGCLTEINFDIAGNHYEGWYDFMCEIGPMTDAGIFEEYSEKGSELYLHYHCPTWQDAKLVIGYANRGYAEKKKRVEEVEAKYEAIAVDFLENIEFTMEDGTKTFLTKDELEKMENLYIDWLDMNKITFITFYIDGNQYKARLEMDLGMGIFSCSNWELAKHPLGRACSELITDSVEL